MYSSQNIIRMIKSRRMKWVGNVARMGRSAFRIMAGKPKGKRPLGKPRRTCKWEDNIKMDLRERGWGGMDWINMGLNRDQWRALVNTV
jgi:hypothetical protein